MNMRKLVFVFGITAVLLMAVLWSAPWVSVGAAQGQTGLIPTDQIIVQFETTAVAGYLSEAKPGDRLPVLSQVAGVTLTYKRVMSGDAHVLKLAEPLPTAEVAVISARLMALAGVVYAEPDHIKQIIDRPTRTVNLTPNDTHFNEQWHYQYTPLTEEGLNLPPAWDITTGSPDTIVAVLDTGILAHTDLAGRTVPGYDFIHDVFVANDGDGRDPDPSDPGDWVTPNECGYPHPGFASSWHGTHVAGTIGAASNNALGVAGVNWQAGILPVRVLGKCGGYTSDIVDGMRWAAGISVGGVPDNANPADVLNLSLGGPGACSTSEQNAINDVVGLGATIVVAAGNSNSDAGNYSPASCDDVITVAATNRTGSRAFYSNYGSVVEISAPGGETQIISNGVLSTLDNGTTVPLHSNTYAFYQGTSMAAPHVAGLASLIKGLAPAHTPAEVLQIIQTTARDFPAGSSCNTTICGAGIADAYQAILGSGVTVLLPQTQNNQAGRGQVASHEITLYNLTGATDSFSLTVGDYVWQPTLSTESVGPVNNGETMTFTVSVTVPVGVEWYMVDTAVVTATSITDPGNQFATAAVVTEAFAPPAITVDALVVTSTQAVGEVMTKTITVSNGNGVTGTFSIQPAPASVFGLTPWLSVNPISGAIASESNQPIHFTFNAQGLQPDVYQTQIQLHSNDPETPVITIPVTMTVSASFAIYLPVLLKPDN